MPTPSPLAPERLPHLPSLAGVRLAVGAAGIRYRGRTDLLLVELAPGTTVAGVFTRSLTAAAPVDWCRQQLSQGVARGILVNSGNANAFTGAAGLAATERSAQAAAASLGCRPAEVFVCSTGVIGEALDDSKIARILPELKSRLSPDMWADAAQAIMTTDTFPKSATRTAHIGDTTVRINGFTKGSGMIAPDMATMLGFIFTDAAIPAPVLQAIVSAANAVSFNATTVDSDTSTNDSVIVCATGQARNQPVAGAADPALRDFRRKLQSLMVELAQLIVRDGEGAQKFITVNVAGAASRRAARRIAFAIANSPLVKTAIAGEDANWGRIVMAVGKSGEKVDRDRLAISIGGVQITENGGVKPGYDETPVARHIKGREIEIGVDIGIGRGRATVWTCDLTHGYIDINASYRS
ncbi:MAG: bifunctional glutamate N-acetyltransferase/amino-acid acetyltransferase ArgJ [Alphaproteobacteria bacterium]